MTREEAIRLLSKPLSSPDKKRRDCEYIRKKLDFSEGEWEEIMGSSPASHDDFPGYYYYWKKTAEVNPESSKKINLG